MKLRSLIVVTFVLGVCLSAAMVTSSQEPTGQVNKSGIMRMKLEPAKNILEAIALGDLQSVRKHTEQIRLLTLDESWMLVQTDAYRQHTKSFERSLNLLNRMCEEKDLDAVTLAYQQVTNRCVECHREVRDARKK
ncbi:MAG: hypothetical protein U0930_21255 [Pirellulales bacterium]